MEESLVREIQFDSERAFEQLFKTHYAALCGYAVRILKDNDEAEEVVQEAFLKIWEKREQIEIIGSVKAYLFRAVHNASLNYLKHQKVRQVYAADVQANYNEQTNGDSVERTELENQVIKAMDELPEKCREVFELSRFEGLKYREIAEKLSISEKTVENQMGKAFKILRERLGAYLKGALSWIIFSIIN